MSNAVDIDSLLKSFHSEALANDFVSDPISEELQMPAFSRKGHGPTILLSAGIHGDEPAGYLAALEFLRRGPSQDFSWLITPMLNPSGIALGTRANANGIDLNRDYERAATAEVAAHLCWIERQEVPKISISLHEDYDGTGFYFYEVEMLGRPSIAEDLLRRVGRKLPIEPGPIIDGRESDGPGHFFHHGIPDPEELSDGLPEAIYLAKHGCELSLTFETPTHAVLIEKRIEGHLIALKAVLDHFRSF